LYIYDGPNTSAPLIGAFNSFTDPLLYLSAIEASINNPSGCLTVHFVSNSTNTNSSGWNAEVSCEDICQDVIASLNPLLTAPAPDTNYIAICPGEEIHFAASVAFPQNDLVYHQSSADCEYLWVFGDGTTATGPTANHTYNAIGGYTVSLFVTDGNGCSSDNSIETRVVIAGNPFIGVSAIEPICAKDTLELNFELGSSGSAIINGENYQEEISTTLGVNDTTFLPDGTGTCYETSVVFNCFNPGQTLENPQDFLSLDVNMEHSFLGDLEISIICPNGQTLVLKEFDGGAGGGTFLGVPIDDDTDLNWGEGYHYSWTPISPTFGTMVEEAGGTLAEGSYRPYGTFADLVGCPLNGEWTIEICDNWASDNGYIFSWQMTLNPDIAPDAWDYTVPIDQLSWVSGPYIVAQSDSSITIVPPIQGNYSYTYQVIDHYGCAWDTTISVPVLTSPNVNLGPDVTFCPGTSSHVFNAQNPGDTYTWHDNSTIATFNATAPGIYHVTVSNGTCEDIDTVQVFAHTGFVLSQSHTDALCFESADGQIDFTAQSDYPPYAYNWSNGASGSHVFGLVAGDYTVTVTDSHQCTITDVVSILQPTAVEASSTVQTVTCYGGRDGEISLTASGGTPGYTYQWQIGQTNADIDSLPAGVYRVTVSDAHLCPLVVDIAVSQAERITLGLPSNHYYCSKEFETIISSATGGHAPYTYTWSTGETTPEIAVSPLQNSSYQLTVFDAHMCQTVEQITLWVYPELQVYAQISRDTVCPGSEVVIHYDAQGGSGNYSASLNGLATLFPTTVMPSDGETFVVKVSDQCYHEVEITLDLHFYPVPSSDFYSEDFAGCPPFNLKLQAMEQNSQFNYIWTYQADGNTANISTNMSPDLWLESGIYNIQLDVTNINGCHSTSIKHSHINVYPQVTAQFVPSDFNVEIINPQIYFENHSINAQTYLWDFGNGHQSQLVNPTEKYSQIGTYPIQLIATSLQNCSDTSMMMVHVEEGTQFYAPTAFSPDGDSNNEVFRIVGTSISKDGFLLQIYNRWGEVIFESSNQEEGWSGKTQGTNTFVQNDVYTWICNFRDTNGNSVEQSGTVSVIR